MNHCMHWHLGAECCYCGESHGRNSYLVKSLIITGGFVLCVISGFLTSRLFFLCAALLAARGIVLNYQIRRERKRDGKEQRCG